MTSAQNPYSTLLQPTDLTFYTRLLSGIDVSAYNINSFVVGIEKDTFDSQPDESNILVATENNNSMSWLATPTVTTDLQLVPLEKLVRRRVVVPEEQVSVTTPTYYAATEQSTVAATWQWLLSLFLMITVTPALVNTFLFVVLYVGWYYYSAVFEMVYLAPLTFADRTSYAALSLAAVYAAYFFLDHMLIEYVEQFGTAVYASYPVPDQQFSRWNILNTSWSDLKYRIYSYVVESFNPSVVVARFAWFVHTASRILGKGLFYMSIVFYVSALLWSQSGVPFSALVSKNSPVYGYAVSGIQQLGIVLPASFASQVWYQQMAGDAYHIGGVANAQPATGYYTATAQQQAFGEIFQ